MRLPIACLTRTINTTQNGGMKKYGVLVCLLLGVLVLSGCGQRVMPKDPVGKINPSHAY